MTSIRNILLPLLLLIIRGIPNLDQLITTHALAAEQLIE
jgi:hypothetical protein